MIMTTLILMAAASAASPSYASGTSPVEHATVHVSPDAVSAIILRDGEKIVDMVVQDPADVDTSVVTGRAVAFRGSPDPRGTHLLIRRETGRPLDVLLLPAVREARSQVFRIGSDEVARVTEWRVHARDVSVLKPGFPVLQAYASTGVRVEALPSDGAMVVTRGSAESGDVVVVGQEGEIGIYRLD